MAGIGESKHDRDVDRCEAAVSVARGGICYLLVQATRVPLYPQWSRSSLNIAFIFFSSKVHNRRAYSVAARAVLHRQNGAEARLAVDHTLIRLRSLSQWVRLDYRFNFSLRYEIKSFVEIFGTILLTANYPNALHD